MPFAIECRVFLLKRPKLHLRPFIRLVLSTPAINLRRNKIAHWHCVIRFEWCSSRDKAKIFIIRYTAPRSGSISLASMKIYRLGCVGIIETYINVCRRVPTRRNINIAIKIVLFNISIHVRTIKTTTKLSISYSKKKKCGSYREPNLKYIRVILLSNIERE